MTIKSRCRTDVHRLAAMLCAMLLYGVSGAQAADYVIDTAGAHASINFRISHLGYSWVIGRFDEFSGNFRFDAANPDASGVSVEIDTASVNSNHAKRDQHIRSDDFLDVDTYPTARFESTSVRTTGPERGEITGNLTLHGVTRPITIDAVFIGEGKDPWGGWRAGFSGTTSFRIADFGIDDRLGPASATVYMDLHVEGVRR